MSRVRTLAHELGHAVTGLTDLDNGHSIDGMNMINMYENPVMTPIDHLVRATYDIGATK